VLTPRQCDVAILGAGLTGMSAAHHLARASVSYRLFEKQAHAGGLAVTREEAGYRFDCTGHLLHLRDDEIRDFALGFIGDEYDWIERHSAIFSHGVFTAYPFQANLFGLPPAVAYECLKGFLDAWRRHDDGPYRDFEHFCLAKFGPGISEHFMVPYNTRMWGAHPREITAAWCQRFVPVPTPEDVVAGATGLGNRALGYNTRFVYPRRGIGVLSSGMAAGLGDAVELSRAPLAIDFNRRELHFEDECVPYRQLIATAPLDALLRLATALPREIEEAVGQLRCNSLYYLDLALERPAGAPFHWIYVPEARFPFYRVGCYSHFSGQMAPPGKAGLYVELVTREPPSLDELLPAVTAGLMEMSIIDGEHDIAFARLRSIENAYVLFDHHHYGALDQIHPFLTRHGVHACGRYGGWNYSSMGDALAFGREAASAVTRQLLGAS